MLGCDTIVNLIAFRTQHHPGLGEHLVEPAQVLPPELGSARSGSDLSHRSTTRNQQGARACPADEHITNLQWLSPVCLGRVSQDALVPR